MQTRRIASANIEHYFKDLFISQRLGYDKPQKEFFDAAFARIENFDPNDAIIIGDSLTSDIKGGINAGIKTVYFNPKGKENGTDIHPDYEIHSLAELAGLLEKM